MNPWIAAGLVIAAWWAVGRPGLTSLVPSGTAGCAPLSPDAIQALIVSGQYPTAGQSAAAGAAAGASLAVATWGISVGVGAAAGYFVRKGSNDTRKDREQFAANLGFSTLNDLYLALDRLGRHDLSQRGLNVIGRADHDANAAWQRDVLVAFVTAGYCL